MNDFAPLEFKYPTTRYAGSKRKLLGWIWDAVKELPFDSVLDVFGGTASVSLLFKRYGKSVHYNDLLDFNQIIGLAVVENSGVRVREDEIDWLLRVGKGSKNGFIARTYKDIFFLDEENEWLDAVIQRIWKVNDPYKQSLLMASLFQACLVKRPFNSFHRANLYIRRARVKRTFGNKVTWERQFPELFRNYIGEYNRSVFSNGKKNKVIGGYDALSAPTAIDLVYLDPPYFLEDSSQGTNYLSLYHFLEGLANYSEWGKRLGQPNDKTKKMPDTTSIIRFTRKTQIQDSFRQLLEHFADKIIVLSYRSGGIPSEREIRKQLIGLGKNVKVHRMPYSYALSKRFGEELLFVAK